MHTPSPGGVHEVRYPGDALPAVARLLVSVDTLMAGVATAEGILDNGLQAAILYHLAAGGRRVRASLSLSASLALGIDEATAVALAAVPELLHNASLIHDDLQDGDTLRRGQAAVWVQYGHPHALLAGDVLLAVASSALASTEAACRPALLRATARAALTTAAGQAADVCSRSDSLTWSEYERLACAKSGPLLELTLELPLLACGEAAAAERARAAAQRFALMYQIIDDLHDTDASSGPSAASPRPPGINAVTVLEASGMVSPMPWLQSRIEQLYGDLSLLCRMLPRHCGASLIALAGRMLDESQERRHCRVA
jgi:geranylgeranyl diphosphate synthase, type I